MIDFSNASFVKLSQTSNDSYEKLIQPLLASNEQIISTYKAMRDGVVFTNKRIIAINVQGITGKKKDFTSIPYSKIQTYSVESAGVFDFDGELDIWLSGVGKVRFEFTGNSKISEICRLISEYALR